MLWPRTFSAPTRGRRYEAASMTVASLILRSNSAPYSTRAAHSSSALTCLPWSSVPFVVEVASSTGSSLRPGSRPTTTARRQKLLRVPRSMASSAA